MENFNAKRKWNTHVEEVSQRSNEYRHEREVCNFHWFICYLSWILSNNKHEYPYLGRSGSQNIVPYSKLKLWSFRCLNDSENVGKNSGVPKSSRDSLEFSNDNCNDKETLVDLGKYSMIPNSGALLYFTLPLSSTSRIQEQMSQYCVNFGITRIWHDRIAFKL